MEWTEPKYDKAEIDRAGTVLRDMGSFKVGDAFRALRALDNFRASHAFPLNTFQVVLRRRARLLQVDALVAQRLKRVPSIIAKLRKQKSMRLSQMQDIGGCRAVLNDVETARALHAEYTRARSNSELLWEKDYVGDPRDSGYRSIHLIYRYHCGPAHHRAPFNGSLIEIQIRSQIQHAWATAVETVGTLTDQALKASEGSAAWLNFFRYSSGLFAQLEDTAPVPGNPEGSELVPSVIAEARRLRVRERLLTFRDALNVLEGHREENERYFLLDLRPAQGYLEITGYREGEVESATQDYLRLEQDEDRPGGSDVVLVRADSIEALRRAYPNYFLDTALFLDLLQGVTGGEV